MPECDPRYIATAKAAVYAQFPEMEGVEPTLSCPTLPGHPSAQRYVLTFSQQVPLSGTAVLNRTVRVTMESNGVIIKITASK